MVSQKGLYKSLKCMIEWTKQQQDRMDEEMPKGHFSQKQWLKEFCVVKFGLPRQSGHTTFAKQLLEEIGLGALYIAPNPDMLRHADILPQHRMTIEGIRNGRHCGRRIQAVIVDCVSLMSQHTLECLYEAFAPIAQHAEPHFIMLLLE